MSTLTPITRRLPGVSRETMYAVLAAIILCVMIFFVYESNRAHELKLQKGMRLVRKGNIFKMKPMPWWNKAQPPAQQQMQQAPRVEPKREQPPVIKKTINRLMDDDYNDYDDDDYEDDTSEEYDDEYEEEIKRRKSHRGRKDYGDKDYSDEDYSDEDHSDEDYDDRDYDDGKERSQKFQKWRKEARYEDIKDDESTTTTTPSTTTTIRELNAAKQLGEDSTEEDYDSEESQEVLAPAQQPPIVQQQHPQQIEQRAQPIGFNPVVKDAPVHQYPIVKPVETVVNPLRPAQREPFNQGALSSSRLQPPLLPPHLVREQELQQQQLQQAQGLQAQPQANAVQPQQQMQQLPPAVGAAPVVDEAKHAAVQAAAKEALMRNPEIIKPYIENIVKKNEEAKAAQVLAH